MKSEVELVPCGLLTVPITGPRTGVGFHWIGPVPEDFQRRWPVRLRTETVQGLVAGDSRDKVRPIWRKDGAAGVGTDFV